MKQDLIQTSFVGGEFGPSLYGRTDIEQYKNASALAQNWIIRPFGSIISTPGTEYINACITGGSTTLTGVRLIPFIFSVSDSYMIEMGAGYFAFYTNGAEVVSNSTQYTVPHSYAPADIPSIQYCQYNDVIYLTHQNYPPQTLTRYGAVNWQLANFPFTGGPFQASNITATTLNANVATSGSTVTLVASGAVFVPSSGSTTGHLGSQFSYGSTVTSSTTGLDVQGYITISTITSPSNATGVVSSALSTTGAITQWAYPSWCAVSGYPSRCAFFQSRLWLARTPTEPQTVWGSGSFAFTNFAVNGGADAMNLQLSATQSNDIKWLAPMNDLIVGTYGGEFCISAGIGTGNPITPATVGVIQQTSWGSEPIVPKKIGNFAYYVQRGAQKLREISYLWTSANYKSTDRTILSPHISGGGFVDMTYQQNPDTVLWMVCSNGTLATMTREVDQEVQGWTRQVTQGSFVSVASIPSQQGPYDEVWAIVTRTINGTARNYVERFASQLLPMQGIGSNKVQQDQLFYVHCGAQYDSFALTSSSTISLSATAGTIAISCSTGYFVAGDVGERIRAVDYYDNILGEVLITGYTSSTQVIGTVKYPFSTTSYSPTYWGVSVTNISGLGYLEAAEVVVCADGGVDYPSKVVSNGTITLGYNYFVVNVGLPAPQILMTMPADPKNERGTSQGKKQRINSLAFKLNNSYSGFSISGTTGTLAQVAYRNPLVNMGVPMPLVTGILPNIPFSDDYRYGSQVYIYNSDPLPVEILSIISTIDVYDK